MMSNSGQRIPLRTTQLRHIRWGYVCHPHGEQEVSRHWHKISRRQGCLRGPKRIEELVILCMLMHINALLHSCLDRVPGVSHYDIQPPTPLVPLASVLGKATCSYAGNRAVTSQSFGRYRGLIQRKLTSWSMTIMTGSTNAVSQVLGLWIEIRAPPLR